DRRRGLIVVTYTGSPEQFVDCGWIVQQGPQGLNKVPGASDQAVFQGVARADGASMRRNLKLDARSVVRVRPVGIYTDVSVNSVYVLTKTVGLEDTSGQQRGRRDEVISFRTGGKGKFDAGTLCQPTGKLELLALDALPRSATVATTAEADLAVASVDENGLACDGADQPYCEALQITAPYREANTLQAFGLRLDVRTTDGVLYGGDIVVLDISFPTYDSYLHVAYLDRAGRVDTLIPGNQQIWPAQAANFVEETAHAIGEPFGVEAIVAIASEQPLFRRARPRSERASTYLSALRQALADLQAEHPGMRIAANVILLRTAPRDDATSAGVSSGSGRPTRG
ncbi:MAG TPA: hypothetical protein VFV80_06970, partial [Geminicoccaceae bacterium]|nr:hypothetical protein [Geminicoccaceae bacterium]